MTMRAEQQVPDLAPLALSWTFLLVGALIVSRRPDNTIGWLFLTIGVVIATQALTNAYGGIAFSQDNNTLLARLAYWHTSWTWPAGAVLLLVGAIRGLIAAIVRFHRARPARVRVQSWIDFRFYRRRYDARRSLEAFAAGLRDETGLGKVTADLRLVVLETLEPEFVMVDHR
jgi:hypothetical protein